MIIGAGEEPFMTEAVYPGVDQLLEQASAASLVAPWAG